MDPQVDLTLALLKDRRSDRRFRYIRLFAIAGLAAAYLTAGVVAFSSRAQDEKAELQEPHIAVVSLKGTIGASDEISFDKVRKHLHSAFEDKSAKAVVLRINSPGGAPVQASLIHDEVLALKKQHPGKKVIAVGEDMVASGGYFIAVAADQLLVNPSTMAGSIGVISSGFGFTGLMEKLGVERRAFTAGASKNGMDPFSPMKEEDRAKYDELLKSIYGHFTSVVLESRKDRLKEAPEKLFTGAVWTGEQAVALGLADGFGSVSTVMADLGAKRMVVYGPTPSLLQVLGSGIGTSAVKEAFRLASDEAMTPELR